MHLHKIQTFKQCTNTPLVKVDIEHTYRNVQVHMDNQHLLQIQWNDQIFVRIIVLLNFGLHSAPKIVTASADPLEDMLLQVYLVTISELSQT